MSRSPSERSTYWRASDLTGLELFKASFVKHRFTRHTHDTYAIGVVERGVQTYWSEGEQHCADRDSIVTLNPHQVHDGESLHDSGYAYRMTYVEPELYAAVLAELSPRNRAAPLFAPIVRDAELAGRLRCLHRCLDPAMAGGCDPLRLQAQLRQILGLLAERHGDNRLQRPRVRRDPDRVRAAKEYLAAHHHRKVSLEEVAAQVGLSPFHFLRLFRSTVGLPPHAWLTQYRLKRATALLAAGTPIAQVAVAVGFVDQSHFTHRFKQVYGVTPGVYLAGLHPVHG